MTTSLTLRTTETKVKVINKNGHFISYIPLYKAEFSVKTNKSSWINEDTIQIMYHHKDEQAFKKEVWIRDNYTCQYCDEQLHADHPDLTVDHVEPKRLGGSILPDNIVCSCLSCNKQKGYRTYVQYFMNLYAGIYFMILWWKCKNIGVGGVYRGNSFKEEKETNIRKTL